MGLAEADAVELVPASLIDIDTFCGGAFNAGVASAAPPPMSSLPSLWGGSAVVGSSSGGGGASTGSLSLPPPLLPPALVVVVTSVDSRADVIGLLARAVDGDGGGGDAAGAGLRAALGRPSRPVDGGLDAAAAASRRVSSSLGGLGLDLSLGASGPSPPPPPLRVASSLGGSPDATWPPPLALGGTTASSSQQQQCSPTSHPRSFAAMSRRFELQQQQQQRPGGSGSIAAGEDGKASSPPPPSLVRCPFTPQHLRLAWAALQAYQRVAGAAAVRKAPAVTSRLALPPPRVTPDAPAAAAAAAAGGTPPVGAARTGSARGNAAAAAAAAGAGGKPGSALGSKPQLGSRAASSRNLLGLGGGGGGSVATPAKRGSEAAPTASGAVAAGAASPAAPLAPVPPAPAPAPPPDAVQLLTDAWRVSEVGVSAPPQPRGRGAGGSDSPRVNSPRSGALGRATAAAAAATALLLPGTGDVSAEMLRTYRPLGAANGAFAGSGVMAETGAPLLQLHVDASGRGGGGSPGGARRRAPGLASPGRSSPSSSSSGILLHTQPNPAAAPAPRTVAEGPIQALVDPDALLGFVFPPGARHPPSAGRLVAFAMHGPLDASGRGLLGGPRRGRPLSGFELDALVAGIEREDQLAAYTGERGGGCVQSASATCLPWRFPAPRSQMGVCCRRPMASLLMCAPRRSRSRHCPASASSPC